MKIAFFIRSMTNGGAEKVAAQLTRIWSKLEHQTILLSELPQKSGEIEYECEYVAREFVGGDTTRIPDKFESLHRLYVFDCVVFNDAVNHDWFRDVFEKAKCLGLRTVIINHHTANNWMYGCCNTRELFMDDLFVQADTMVCVDRMWALWWKYRGVKSVFIQNPVCVEPRNTPKTRNGGITLVKSVDEAVEKLKGKNRIVWIGRLRDALKRPDLAIEVFSKLICELVSVGVVSERVEELPTLTMLGTYDKATESHLRKLFNSLTPPLLHSSTLNFPGFVTNVGEYLAKADAHLFTSATEVTIPQVLLEARAAGVETVAFDMPVLRQVIEPRNTLNTRKEEEEKWRKVLAGESVECDFDAPDVRQNLMDELHRSQQWFVIHHLPELRTFRRLRSRLNPIYLFKRLKSILAKSGN